MNSIHVAEELAERGHECQSWFLVKSGDLKSSKKINYKVFVIKNFGAVVSLLFSFFILLFNVFKFKPDVIIGFHPLSNIFGSLASLLSGRRTRFIASQRNPSGSQGRITGFMDRILGRTSLYDFNIAVTNAVAQSYTDYPISYREKLVVVYNGTPSLPDVMESRDSCRERFEFPADSVIIGSIGRLAEQKNPRFLVRLLPELPKKFRLAFAGEGPLYSQLVNDAITLGVSERVAFVGQLNGTDISRFYKAVDIFALPSLFEGFGRTLVEAMSKEVPIVANDLPVTREVVGDAGILRPLNEELWLEAFNLMSSNPESVSILKSKGLIRVERFTSKSMIDGYEEFCILSVNKKFKI